MIRVRTGISRITNMSMKASFKSYVGNKTLGILRESHGVWERRAPLSPIHVKELLKIDSEIKVLIQPCSRRVFSNEEYEQAGAVINEDLSAASLIIGVKATTDSNLLANKSYMFFSHVIKAQLYSMEMLDSILDRRIRLFDYECITKEGKDDKPRLVFFGQYAGRAGFVDGIHGLGLQLLAEGYSTPFLSIPSTYTFKQYSDVIKAFKTASEDLKTFSIPKPLMPIVIAFTGSGNVSEGARELFELLPHQYVTVEELPKLREQVASGAKPSNMLYGVVVKAKDMVRRKVDYGVEFCKDEYYRDPSLYEASFHENILPHITMLVNCMYWESRFPRLITNQQLKDLRATNNFNFKFLADITCDINGSVELLSESTTLESPYYTFSPENNNLSKKLTPGGVMVLAVDNLPSALPKDASNFFGDALLPFLKPVLVTKGSDTQDDIADIPIEIRRACITSHGELMPKWSYIARLRESTSLPQGTIKDSVAEVEMMGHLFDTGLINQVLDTLEDNSEINFAITNCDVRSNTTAGAVHSIVRLQITGYDTSSIQKIVKDIEYMITNHPRAQGSFKLLKEPKQAAVGEIVTPRRVLLFGSGRVARPIVEVFAGKENTVLTIATNDEKQVQELIDATGVPARNVIFKKFVYPQDNENLNEMIKNCDIVVSLLPAAMHTMIAEEAINQSRNMVTASYVSPEMKKLDGLAREKNVTILNEVGLDPGIDHLLVMKAVDNIHKRGGVVKELISLCGGLPDPVSADNPFRYKLSWSPKGMLSATGNSARYLLKGELIEVPGNDLLLHGRASSRFPTLRLEALPNRDSLGYKELYGVPNVHSICRGTLRYEGWSNAMHALKVMGLLEDTAINSESTSPNRQLIDHLEKAFNIKVTESSLRARFLTNHVRNIDEAIEAFRWLGLLEDDDTVNDKETKACSTSSATTVRDAVCQLFEEKMKFADGEKDMVAMFHSVVGEMPDGTIETHDSHLLAFGLANSLSAMSATVGYTTAAATEMLLDGTVQQKAIASGKPLTGVIIPTSSVVYEYLLNSIESFGITWTEDVKIKRPTK